MPESFKEWCLVELFGHQRIVGQVSETTMAGGAFLRVDVPAVGGSKAFTRFYSPGAIYALSPMGETEARAMVERYHPDFCPVSRFELPQLAEKLDENAAYRVPPGQVTTDGDGTNGAGDGRPLAESEF